MSCIFIGTGLKIGLEKCFFIVVGCCMYCVECSRTHILAKKRWEVTQTGQLLVEMGKIKSKS